MRLSIGQQSDLVGEQAAEMAKAGRFGVAVGLRAAQRSLQDYDLMKQAEARQQRAAKKQQKSEVDDSLLAIAKAE